MQQRDNNIPQQLTPDGFDITSTTAPAQNVGSCVDQIGHSEAEEEIERTTNMSPNSQQLSHSMSHADSFLSASSLDSSASGLLTSVMKIRIGDYTYNKPAQRPNYPQQDVSATATLAAQALQNPALSESALLLLRSLRETANLERAPRSIMEQHEQAGTGRHMAAQAYGTLSPIPRMAPKMNHEEKVQVLRRLYASRTRNKVSGIDSDKDNNTDEVPVQQEQVKGQETSERSRDGGISGTLKGELRKMIAMKKSVKTVTPHSTPDTNANGTEAQRQVPLPKQGTIIQVIKNSQPMLRPCDDMLKASNKRKSSSLDDDGHGAKRIKFASAATAAASSPAAKPSSTKRTFASRCA